MHRQNLVTIHAGHPRLRVRARRLADRAQPEPRLQQAADDFTDVAAFLAKGGQKGLQRKILREGTYAINLAQFVVLTESHVYALNLPGDGNVSAKGGSAASWKPSTTTWWRAAASGRW